MLQRPIGFRPWEISALVNREVIDQHSEEAAFLWTQRDQAVASPRYTLKHLAKLDGRVEAHVDGLRVAAEVGWETCLAVLGAGPGEVFAGAILAFGSGDASRIQLVLEAGSSDPLVARGLISALGWLAKGRATDAAMALVGDVQPEVRRTGIAACAIHRIDPGPPLGNAIMDPTPRLAARAAKAAAELGQVDLFGQILSRVSDFDPDCRFWAAWSAARLGEKRPNVLQALREAAQPSGRHAQAASEMALRCMSHTDGKLWCRDLAQNPKSARLAAIGLGVIGDPAGIDTLVRMMEDPALARAAGGSFSMITGADLGYEDLSGDAPESVPESPSEEPTEADVATDPDAHFEWPVPAKVAKWWAKRKSGYEFGVRYLRGKPITEATLREALSNGMQNQRAAASLLSREKGRRDEHLATQGPEDDVPGPGRMVRGALPDAPPLPGPADQDRGLR